MLFFHGFIFESMDLVDWIFYEAYYTPVWTHHLRPQRGNLWSKAK